MPPGTLSNGNLLLVALISIVGLVLLVARFKMPAFIALLIASLFMGVVSGLPLTDAVGAFELGFGNTLKQLGMIIGLGTILGKMLAESGASEAIAARLIKWLGLQRLDYAVMLMAFFIGISVFFNVGLLLLGPIAFTLARETRTPILRLGLPLAAGFSVAHGLIPPHPGPMTAIGLLKADTGKTILWSLVLGLPTALITGPLLARWVAPRVPVELGGLGAEETKGCSAPRRPSFGISVFTMLLPVLLMVVGTAADIAFPLKEHPARQLADFVGSPTVALLLAVLVSFYTFGFRCGLTGPQIAKFAESCVAPAAGLFLIIGAGGGFSNVLRSSGAGEAIAALAKGTSISPLILGWGIAGLLRVAVGSATVSITMASGLMAPIIADSPGVNKELLVLAMGAGSLILSHVNDSGFWFIKEYFGMTVGQTFRTWTVVETGIAVTSLVLILAGNWISHFF